MGNQLHWPSVIGARTKEGHVCVGTARTRSKHCLTALRFYQEDGDPYRILATDVAWQIDGTTAAVLAEGLREIIREKRRRLFPHMTTGFCGYDLVTRYTWPPTTLYVHEVGGGAFYRRFLYRFPFDLGLRSGLARLEQLGSPTFVHVVDRPRDDAGRVPRMPVSGCHPGDDPSFGLPVSQHHGSSAVNVHSNTCVPREMLSAIWFKNSISSALVWGLETRYT